MQKEVAAAEGGSSAPGQAQLCGLGGPDELCALQEGGRQGGTFPTWRSQAQGKGAEPPAEPALVGCLALPSPAASSLPGLPGAIAWAPSPSSRPNRGGADLLFQGRGVLGFPLPSFPPPLLLCRPPALPFPLFLPFLSSPTLNFWGPTRDEPFGGRKEDGDKDDEGEEMEMKQTMQMRGLLLLLPALWALFSRDFRAVTGKEIPLRRVPSRPGGRQPTLDLIFTGSCPFHALPPA